MRCFEGLVRPALGPCARRWLFRVLGVWVAKQQERTAAFALTLPADLSHHGDAFARHHGISGGKLFVQRDAFRLIAQDGDLSAARSKLLRDERLHRSLASALCADERGEEGDRIRHR